MKTSLMFAACIDNAVREAAAAINVYPANILVEDGAEHGCFGVFLLTVVVGKKRESIIIHDPELGLEKGASGVAESAISKIQAMLKRLARPAKGRRAPNTAEERR